MSKYIKYNFSAEHIFKTKIHLMSRRKLSLLKSVNFITLLFKTKFVNVMELFCLHRNTSSSKTELLPTPIKMVGLWSPDPPPEPENLEENNSGYIIVVSASDEEPSDEGYEGYEPLSDADENGTDSDSDIDEIDPQFVIASTPDSDMRERARSADLPKPVANSCEFCKNLLSASGENVDEDSVAGLSTGNNEQGSSHGAQSGPSSSRLEMGEQQVADVMAAMANVTLPPSAVPQWATVVPEDQWIQHILARVKVLQDKRLNDK